jgi:hypothetical protein
MRETRPPSATLSSMTRFAPALPLFALPLVAADFRDIAAHARGVVILEVEVPGGLSQGTAFAVGDGTLLVTARHVVEGARSVRVRLSHYDDDAVEVLEVAAVDAAHDLALLKLAAPLPPLVVSPDPAPPAGSPVLAIGNPHGLGVAFTDGIVSRVHDDLDGIVVVQHSAPISPGNSGGPLLDAQGRVIGVNSFALAAAHAQNVNFAIDARHVRALLADPTAFRPRRPVVLRPPPPLPPPERVREVGRAWTAPEGQPRCAVPEEPTWPFPEELRLHELAAVSEDPRGVCRHGRVGPAGPHVVFARYAGVDARDARLDAVIGELGLEAVEPGDPCQRAARGAVDVMTQRNRDLLYVWLRAAEGTPAELCAMAARIRDGAKPAP